MDESLKDRILGCLVGGAVGDALGYPVEFMYYDQILAKYGTPGINRYELNHNGIAEISDDTQMTLYTANGILIRDIKAAYLEWFHTQRYNTAPTKGHKCWISDLPEMYSCRAPGNTCLSALSAIDRGMQPNNDSKGCGGIMRVAPIAIWGASHNIDIRESVVAAFDAAKLTHMHTLGWLPAGMLVFVIQKILQEVPKDRDSLVEILNDRNVVYEPIFNPDTASAIDEFDRGTKKAIELAYTDMADVKAISQLGEGWTGDEAWYISLYCALRHFDSFEDAVVSAVNHNGDSDSTGAITGNIMGAIHGYSGIPEYYKNNLELHDVILKMTDDLINGHLS